MTVKELYRYFDQKIPRDLSCDWDNDGYMCCPEADREVKRVLVALDATGEIVDTAINGGYDLIVTHHPFIFDGLRRINEESFVAAKAMKLIKNGVASFSFHTRLDAVEGGVNDVLASLIGLENAVPFGADGISRIGDLPVECTAEELAARVRDVLGAPFVWLSECGRSCSRVAVLGGGGGSFMGEAMSAGADTYISGDFSFHALTDGPDQNINLIQAGHFYTEDPVCARIRELVLEADPTIECDVVRSDRIKAI